MKSHWKTRAGALLLSALLSAGIAPPVLADGGVGALPLKQWPAYRSAKIYLSPQVEQPLVFLGCTRLYDQEGLFVLKSVGEDAAVLRGADRALYLVPRVPREGGKARLSDWNVFIANWGRAKAIPEDAMVWHTGQGGVRIGATGVLLAGVGLSPNDHTDLMRQDMDYLAVQEDGIWYPLAPIMLHAGYVVGGVPEKKIGASYAALPATALAPLSHRVKNIAYRNDRNIAVAQNGAYLVVAVTEDGDLLYSVARVTNVQ